jgi:hypothetical protein
MKTITVTEFNKKMDVEFAHYTHIDGMPEKEARQKAYETVSKEYKVE